MFKMLAKFTSNYEDEDVSLEDEWTLRRNGESYEIVEFHKVENKHSGRTLPQGRRYEVSEDLAENILSTVESLPEGEIIDDANEENASSLGRYPIEEDIPEEALNSEGAYTGMVDYATSDPEDPNPVIIDSQNNSRYEGSVRPQNFTFEVYRDSEEDWEVEWQGLNPQEPYHGIIGSPEEIMFEEDAGMNLPAGARRLFDRIPWEEISQDHGTSPEDIFETFSPPGSSNIFDEEESEGISETKERVVSASEGMINQSSERTVEYRGAIIPENLVETWRGVLEE